MEIEFLGRWQKQPDKAQTQLKRLGIGDEEDEVEYIYKPLVLEIDSVGPFNEFDAEHVMLRTAHDIFIVKCKFRLFKFLKETLTAKIIRHVEDFAIEEQLLNKAEMLSNILNKSKVEQQEQEPRDDFGME